MEFSDRPSVSASVFEAIRLQESLCLAVFHWFPAFSVRTVAPPSSINPDALLDLLADFSIER